MAAIDLTNKIEVLDAFGERLGVSLKSLSAFLNVDGDYIFLNVRGDIHAATGANVEHDFSLVISAYDSDDRNIATSESYYSADDFYGFEAFSESLDLPINDVGKIKVYPKKG